MFHANFANLSLDSLKKNFFKKTGGEIIANLSLDSLKIGPAAGHAVELLPVSDVHTHTHTHILAVELLLHICAAHIGVYIHTYRRILGI
jgi:hypothetical protein